MKKLKLTLVRSVIDRSQRQKDTVRALGLRRTNHTIVKEVSPQVQGMINKVSHLLQIEEA